MDMHAIWYVLAAVLVIVGLAGIVLPALPGLPLVFCGMLLAAWTDGFQRVEWWWLLVLGVLTLLSMAIDFWATAVGAKRVGASRKALAGCGARHLRRTVLRSDRPVRRPVPRRAARRALAWPQA